MLCEPSLRVDIGSPRSGQRFGSTVERYCYRAENDDERLGKSVKITSRGQVTIPRYIRERTGLLPGTEVDFQLDEDGAVRLVRPDRQPPDPALVQAIEQLRGRADTSMSTEEIMALTRG